MDSMAKDQKRIFENITDLIPFGMMLVSPSHDIEYRNKQFDEIFGHGYPKSLNLSQWFNTTFPDQNFRNRPGISSYMKCLIHSIREKELTRP